MKVKETTIPDTRLLGIGRMFAKGTILITIFAISAMLSAGCDNPIDSEHKPKEPEPQLSSEKAITAFGFTASANSSLYADAVGVISGRNIYVPVPFETEIGALIATFTTTGKTVTVNGVNQLSGTTPNDFSEPVAYAVTAEDGTMLTYTVTVEICQISGLSPADGAATAGNSVTLRWDPVSTATGYEIQIASTAEGVAGATAETTTENRLVPDAPPQGSSWYWRVRAMGNDNPLTEWSPIASCILNWGAFPTVLTGPVNSSTTSDTTPLLTWEAVIGAESYEVQYAAGSQDAMLAAVPITSHEASHQFEDALDNNSTYYWRVRAVSTDAVTGEIMYSPYSIPRSFTVSWGTSGPADGIRFGKELAQLADPAFRSGTYELAGDIDLGGYGEWTPIGSSANPFSGTFDGKNYTISGLSISGNEDCRGLFGYVQGGTIRNVNLTGASLTGNSQVGPLAGSCYDNATISNCHAGGTVSGRSGIGGLVGYSRGTVAGEISITDSTADCEVSGSETSIGGLLGAFNGYYGMTLRISNCASRGNVYGTGGSTGGLAGRIWFHDCIVSITDSSASGSVEGGAHVGGLIGLLTSEDHYDSDVQIRYCHAAGNVTGSGNNTGGLVGYSGGIGEGSILIEYCRAGGEVRGTDSVGGLIGADGMRTSSSTNQESTISACFATGNVSGPAVSGGGIGGLVGSHYTYSSISDSYAVGDVTGNQSIGGFTGYSSGEIRNSFSAGFVSGTEYVGGFIGQNYGGSISSCFYDRETSGRSDTGKGTPLFTTEMKTLETFINAGWDFADETVNGAEDIWDIDSAWQINGRYPYFVGMSFLD